MYFDIKFGSVKAYLTASALTSSIGSSALSIFYSHNQKQKNTYIDYLHDLDKVTVFNNFMVNTEFNHG